MTESGSMSGRVLGLILFSSLALPSAFGEGEQAREEAKPAGVDLRKLLSPGNPVAPFPRTPLVPEWVGTVRQEGKEPRHIRLSDVGREAPADGRKGRIWVARMRSDGSHIGADHARFYKTLPLAFQVKKASTLAHLESWFGPPEHGGLSGHFDGERAYWIESWNCFTRLEDGNLRWLGVSACVSKRKSQAKNPVLVRVESVEIREGDFRPSDPGSAEGISHLPGHGHLAHGNGVFQQANEICGNVLGEIGTSFAVFRDEVGIRCRVTGLGPITAGGGGFHRSEA